MNWKNQKTQQKCILNEVNKVEGFNPDANWEEMKLKNTLTNYEGDKYLHEVQVVISGIRNTSFRNSKTEEDIYRINKEIEDKFQSIGISLYDEHSSCSPSDNFSCFYQSSTPLIIGHLSNEVMETNLRNYLEYKLDLIVEEIYLYYFESDNSTCRLDDFTKRVINPIQFNEMLGIKTTHTLI